MTLAEGVWGGGNCCGRLILIAVCAPAAQEGQLTQFQVPLLFSRTDTLATVRAKAISSYYLPDGTVARLWYRPEPTVTWRPLRNLSATLEQEDVSVLCSVCARVPIASLFCFLFVACGS